jgi:cation:H+ antiporter
LVWLKFAACIAIIIFSGTSLARYGDAISEKTGLGRIWIGLLLLAAITSMPELITGISAAALVKISDLAVGTLLGSCIFNLMLVAVLDAVYRPAPVLSGVNPCHIASAVTGIIIAAVAVAGIALGVNFPAVPVGWTNLFGILPLAIYLIGLWWVFHLERKNRITPVQIMPDQYEDLSMRTVCLRFALSAAAVIGAGIWLSYVGEEIAVTYSLDTSFVGTLLLAITTSMPELVVSLAILRLGAIDMAIADILGSNMFNLALITPVDLAYRQGPVLSSISGANVVTALLVIVMSLLVILGIRFGRNRKTFFVASWYSVALVALYIFGIYNLFTSGGG